ncbi:uncharacterized protein BDR25DRAFT_280024 [Lindgomyces ingoldianus]|uniref:Uncharacterized protein n=1 Tax=Lindgomyces ingoldianus TaxID=673940 RepID=A0ACB6R6C8_9PLEO|nr:uncharacterized protein BDR25DRAFT_280024 [Lindgomyces ingoldianus]KAF2474615.1 hypothetical protein BDR25DRAFT_280024 [Lindgomyces ingoldianus]
MTVPQKKKPQIPNRRHTMAPRLPHIPLPYRILLLWFEPLAALNGAILCHFNPVLFLDTMTAKAVFAPSHQVIFDQLSATYTLFAFNEAVVLRITKDLKVWKAMVFGMLLCDLIHLYGSWSVMGPQVFLDPTLWRAGDALNLAMLYVPIMMRLSFLMEIGFKKEGKIE